MSEERDVWPDGAPAIGSRAAMTREVLPEDIERFTALSGEALCHTMPLPAKPPGPTKP